MLEIHQAYFGAVRGVSHGELASSLPNTRLRSYLAGVTDRPAVPASYELPAYLSADSFDGYYLLFRTWPDQAVQRSGLVFTHVLMVRQEQLEVIQELGSVLGLLLAAPPPVAERSTTLAPLRLPEPISIEEPKITALPVSWLSILGQLVEATESAPVYIYSEAALFQAFLEALWRGLPSPLRQQLTWGIRFIPPATQETAPRLVRVPEELASKWLGRQVIKLDINELKEPTSPIERMIFAPIHVADFRSFLSELAVTPISFKELRQCQRAFQQYEMMEGKASAGELLALVRTLRHVQPEPGKALALKHRAVEALVAAVQANGITEAMALRNLEVTAFAPQDKEQLDAAVGWAVNRLVLAGDQKQTQRRELLSYLAEKEAGVIEAWWQAAAGGAFRQALEVPSAAGAGIIWIGITESEHVRNYTTCALPVAVAWEQQLHKSCPAALTKAAADAVTTFCVAHGWWDLFAKAVEAAYAPAEALRRVVEAEKRLKLTASPRVAQVAGRVTGAELVKLAVQEATQQLIGLAGTRCGEDAYLLAPMDVHQKSWRLIWSISLAHSKSLTVGLRNATETINTFLAEVAAGHADEQLPLELMAASVYANVLLLPERAQVWSKLPVKLRQRFVAATLDALVMQILAGDVIGKVDDLLTYAQDVAFNTKFLYQQRHDLSAVLMANSILKNLTDSYLQDYIRNLPTATHIVAAQVGKLIQERNWHKSADALLSKAKYDAAFRPGLQECASMFSTLTKLLHYQAFGQKLTSEDAWQALTDCMIELYRKGPDDEHIWQRAGGDATLLNDRQNRREQWASAIGLLQRGGGGKKITAKALVNCALEDFKNNSTLLTLRELLHLL
jgi:hypothetical protein